MANSKLEVDIVMKNSPEKVWENLKDFVIIFPKALPHMYESIEIIQGDGKSVGSVLKATFKSELKDVVLTISKERIDSIDEEKKTISYSFIEGDILKYYKNFKATVSVCVTAGINENGCLVKYSAEFEKANEQSPDPILYRDFAAKLFQDFDAYLINA